MKYRKGDIVWVELDYSDIVHLHLEQRLCCENYYGPVKMDYVNEYASGNENTPRLIDYKFNCTVIFPDFVYKGLTKGTAAIHTKYIKHTIEE